MISAVSEPLVLRQAQDEGRETVGQAPQRMQRARGIGRISTKLHDGTTHLHTLYQEGCAKIRLPHTHSPALEAVLINTTGGLCGGDEIGWEATTVDHGRMVLTTQACERAYRSNSGPARSTIRLCAGEHAAIDWLPQETILFEDSALERTIEIDLAPTSRLCAVEAVLLGRDAMGEMARRARLRDSWRIRRGGRLIHAEETTLDGEGQRDLPSLLAGNRAFATILYVGADAEARLDAVRERLKPGAAIAASATGERLVVRAVAPTGLDLRRLIVPVIALLSGAGALPRLWSI